MELKRVETQRTQLLQFVLFLLLLMLAVIGYSSFAQRQGGLVPWLTVVSLLACLYVIGKERRLRKLEKSLTGKLLEEQAKSASLEARLQELSGLYRAISAVNSVVDAERTFDTVLRAALDLVDGNRGSIMILDETRHLVIASARGLNESVVSQTRQPIGSGVAGWVAENCEPVLVEDEAAGYERFRDLVHHQEKVHHAMSIPLELRGELMGVLNLGVTGEVSRRAFTACELRIATIFAQHASVAIENARLRLNELIAVYRR